MPDPLTDRRGLNAVEGVFLNHFGWAFREQAVVDFGIDAQVEVVEGDKLTGKLIPVLTINEIASVASSINSVMATTMFEQTMKALGR